MDKMKLESADITSKNIEKIAELFPNCITETKDKNGNLMKAINFELLKQDLSKDIVDGKECYEFTWVGKKESIIEANRPIRKTLRPCKEGSVNWDTTENLYIEGDNLEVLKLLQESYLGKVKMIYIDPPYNTGNDFIYNDAFKVSKDEYENESGIINDLGNRFVKNTDTNGRFHSDWCSMIYSRLMVARNILSEDGVIFISIDDNEEHNIRNMCDEIFGLSNFIGEYIKQSKIGGGSDSKFLVKEHEYCVVYAKNITKTNEMFVKHDQDYLKRYKETDENGRYFWDTFARPGLKNPIVYEITVPDGSILKDGWIHSKERFIKELEDGTVRIIQKKNGDWSVQFKQYLNLKGKKPRSMTMDFGGSIEGKNDIKLLFSNDKYFPYPKSVKFISTLINTIQDDCIILDFFSGSSTTAHAVMQLNAEDGGNRKFIMVQLPEPCDEKSEAFKAGYKNICEIGKERIRRAAKKIAEDNPNAKFDGGFRVFKVDDSNMKDVYYAPADYNQSLLDKLESNIKEDRTDLDLFFGCILDWGLPLNLSYTSETIENCSVHTYSDNALIACFNDNIPESVIKEIAKRKPLRVVFRDSSFADTPSKINVTEIFKLLSPDTRVKVI